MHVKSKRICSIQLRSIRVQILPLSMGFTIDVWIYIVCVCMSGRNVVLLGQMRAHQHQHDLPTNLIIIINNINNIAFAHVRLFEHATLDLFTCVSERACFLVGKLLVIRTIHYTHTDECLLSFFGRHQNHIFRFNAIVITTTATKRLLPSAKRTRKRVDVCVMCHIR